MPFRKLDYPRNESILWGSINKGNVLKNGSDSEDGGWRNLLVSSFDGFHQVIGSIIHAIDEIGIALRVGGPLDNDLIKTIFELEIAVNESAFGLRGRK